MKTIAIIEGLTILEKYRDEPNGFNTEIEHDMLYAYCTDEPVDDGDLNRLVELGWIQGIDFEDEGEFLTAHYNSDEDWICYT